MKEYKMSASAQLAVLKATKEGDYSDVEKHIKIYKYTIQNLKSRMTLETTSWSKGVIRYYEYVIIELKRVLGKRKSKVKSNVK